MGDDINYCKPVASWWPHLWNFDVSLKIGCYFKTLMPDNSPVEEYFSLYSINDHKSVTPTNLTNTYVRVSVLGVMYPTVRRT